MDITISDVVLKVNKKLNYPAVSYEDLDVYFDQAVSEINTMMSIAIPPITQLVIAQSANAENLPNVIVLSSMPSSGTTIPTDSALNTAPYYYDAATLKYKVLDSVTGAYVDYDDLYASFINYSTNFVNWYKGWVLGSTVVWYPYAAFDSTSFKISDYLPSDWINLFLIPYICAGFASRDGSNTNLFTDEFIQGYQQLQKSWDVPSLVYLASMAHHAAYSAQVEEMIAAGTLTNTFAVATRAIVEEMRTTSSVPATYDSSYDNIGSRWL